MSTPESMESVGASDATPSLPEVRTIAPRDLLDVLAKGFNDFLAMPTHVIFLSLIRSRAC